MAQVSTVRHADARRINRVKPGLFNESKRRRVTIIVARERRLRNPQGTRLIFLKIRAAGRNFDSVAQGFANSG